MLMNQDDLSTLKTSSENMFSSHECVAATPPILDPIHLTYKDICREASKFNTDPTILRSRHTKRVTCLDWHYSGEYLATGSLDASVCIYSINTILKAMKQNKDVSHMLKKYMEPRFDPITQREHTAHARDLFCEQIYPLPMYDDFLILNSKYFYYNNINTTKTDGKLNSNNTNTNTNINNENEIKMQHTKINCLKWQPKDDKKSLILATGSKDSTVFLWNISSFINLIHKQNLKNLSQIIPFHCLQTASSIEKMEFTHSGSELICLNRGDKQSATPYMIALDIKNFNKIHVRLRLRMSRFKHWKWITDFQISDNNDFLLFSTKKGNIHIYGRDHFNLCHIIETTDSPLYSLDLNTFRYVTYLNDQRSLKDMTHKGRYNRYISRVSKYNGKKIEFVFSVKPKNTSMAYNVVNDKNKNKNKIVKDNKDNIENKENKETENDNKSNNNDLIMNDLSNNNNNNNNNNGTENSNEKEKKNDESSNKNEIENDEIILFDKSKLISDISYFENNGLNNDSKYNVCNNNMLDDDDDGDPNYDNKNNNKQNSNDENDNYIYPVYNKNHVQKYDKYSPYMITGGKNGTLYLYKLHNMTCLYGKPISHFTGISKVRFNPEGNTIAVGGDTDGSIKFIFSPNGKTIYPTKKIAKPITLINSNINNIENNNNNQTNDNSTMNNNENKSGNTTDIVMSNNSNTVTNGTAVILGSNNTVAQIITLNGTNGRHNSRDRSRARDETSNSNNNINNNDNKSNDSNEVKINSNIPMIDIVDVINKDGIVIDNLCPKAIARRDYVLYHHRFNWHIRNKIVSNPNIKNNSNITVINTNTSNTNNMNNNNNANNNNSNNNSNNSNNNNNNSNNNEDDNCGPTKIEEEYSSHVNLQYYTGYGLEAGQLQTMCSELHSVGLNLVGTERSIGGPNSGPPNAISDTNDNEKEKAKKRSDNIIYDIAWNPNQSKYFMIAFCDDTGNGTEIMENQQPSTYLSLKNKMNDNNNNNNSKNNSDKKEETVNSDINDEYCDNQQDLSKPYQYRYDIGTVKIWGGLIRDNKDDIDIKMKK